MALSLRQITQKGAEKARAFGMPGGQRKLERELGWRPAETFETGIRKTVRWYLDNEDWVREVQSGAYREWIDANYGRRQA